MSTAILGGGCFWCLEAVFEEVRGIRAVVSGYAGGHRPHPSYEQVCTGVSGHAEIVQLDFDPAVISFREILEIFFAIHDPTTLNRQGNDSGSQYRSVIFCQDDGQRHIAESLIAALNQSGAWPSPIVTEVVMTAPFYPAEAYHQHYFARNPGQGYCQFVVAPKVLKFRHHFPDWRKQAGDH